MGIDLHIPKFSHVMISDGEQHQEVTKSRNFNRWLQHLGIVDARLTQKITILNKKRRSALEEIIDLQKEQQALIDKLWQRAKDNTINN